MSQDEVAVGASANYDVRGPKDMDPIRLIAEGDPKADFTRTAARVPECSFRGLDHFARFPAFESRRGEERPISGNGCELLDALKSLHSSSQAV